MVKLRSVSWLIIGLFLFSFAFQVNYNGQMQTNVQNSTNSFHQIPLSLGQDEGEEDFPHAIMSNPLNSLGEIEITSVDLPADPTPVNFLPSSSDIVTYDHKDPIFLGTITNASAERAIGEEDPRISNITIQFSESVIWTYNESATEYIVGFTPVLQTAFLEKMYFNGTELDSSDYFVNSTGNGAEEKYNFYYDFKDDFDLNKKDEFNLTYVYNIIFPITEWSVTNTEPNQYISETNQTFTQGFSYHVSLGEHFSHINTLARLKFFLPNHQDIFESELDNLNNETIPSNQYFLDDDNILTLVNKTDLSDINTLDLTFKANFTVEMIDVVDGLWSEDRLVEGLSIRERDYKIIITEGPANLILMNIGINETGIFYKHLFDGGHSGKSALGRHVSITNMNKSTGTEIIEPNDTTTLPEYVDGISFLQSIESDTATEPYWLLKNEIDIITIKYTPKYNLSIIIMDKIGTPIEGYGVKLYIGNVLYGTTISNFTIMPYPMIKSNENGEIVFHSVPVANYTIEIYNRNGKYLENATVTPLEEINSVVTNIPHYPVTILIFTGISIAFIVIGYVIFKKNS